MAVALLILFLLVIFIGVPVAFSMGFVTVAAFSALGGNMLIIAQKMFSALDTSVYLCIILFVLAAEIMARGEITANIVKFCDCLVGHLPGGLAHVNVLGSMLFAGISGSATADVASLGPIEIEMMERGGYSRDYAASVTAASAIIGPIIPPSSIMIIYAACAGNVSIGKMFVGGLIPGVLLGAGYMTLCYIFAVKRNHPRRAKRATLQECLSTLWQTLPSLFLPLIIMGGITSGIFTATESGAIACVYAIVVSLARKRLSLRDFFEACVNTAKATANVTFIIAVASAMGWAITTLHIPQTVTEFCLRYINSPGMFLLFVNVVLLLIGFILDQSPALLVMVPILLPAAMQYGIDPLQFGLICCINLTVGLITPPVGMTLFVTANVAKVKLSHLYAQIYPFVCVAIIVLILITYIPALTTWLPNLLMK